MAYEVALNAEAYYEAMKAKAMEHMEHQKRRLALRSRFSFCYKSDYMFEQSDITIYIQRKTRLLYSANQIDF